VIQPRNSEKIGIYFIILVTFLARVIVLVSLPEYEVTQPSVVPGYFMSLTDHFIDYMLFVSNKPPVSYLIHAMAY